MATTHLLRVRNAAEVACVCTSRELFKRGRDQDVVHVLQNATIVVAHGGRIERVGGAAEMEAEYATATFERDIDATGMSVVPGLVDGHTHPVWAGDRVHEFSMKLAGATYMDIHKIGGGINFTVRATRAASEEELLELLLGRLDRALSQGTTTLEGKSGYGLEAETEIKMLRVMHRAKGAHAVDVISTFCGAHAVPQGSTEEQAAEDVIGAQIPEVARLNSEGLLDVRSIDVFCEKGVFELDTTERILEAGKSAGLLINFHGEELNYLGSAQMGARLGASAISHLEEVSAEGIAAMADTNVAAVLLPTTAYILRLKSPPARRMIDERVCVALGSDFNPNAHCLSMPMTMNMACVLMRMTLNEALVAATINAAYSLGLSHDIGSIEQGKVADLVLLAAPKWEHLIYQMIDPPIKMVFKAGRPVLERS